MKQTVNEHDFCRAFEALRPDNFSRMALIELYDYLTEMEDDTGEEMELDVIAICCDFAEYTLEEVEAEYSYLINESVPAYDYLAEEGEKAKQAFDILTESGALGVVIKVESMCPMTGDPRYSFVIQG